MCFPRPLGNLQEFDVNLVFRWKYLNFGLTQKNKNQGKSRKTVIFSSEFLLVPLKPFFFVVLYFEPALSGPLFHPRLTPFQSLSLLITLGKYFLDTFLCRLQLRMATCHLGRQLSLSASPSPFLCLSLAIVTIVAFNFCRRWYYVSFIQNSFQRIQTRLWKV